MQLNVLEVTSPRTFRRNDAGTDASVVMTQSMVAIFGEIIPAPFDMPPIRNVFLPTFTS
jgi:hypothetical protein